ncbi:TPA: hypothetical protein DDW35_04825 [Candidatus Sumerlaeota bacterium]|jgi:outer membrane protein|nr:hypothetical protein [Candidatus Sumerlaeota bacterium]
MKALFPPFVSRTFAGCLILVLPACLVACSSAVQTYRQAFAPYKMLETPSQITEDIKEIDTYRASDQRHSIQGSLSTNGAFQGMGDQPTTAALQFSGPVFRIQVKDVLLTTLKNNSNLRVEDYNRTIADKGIEAARGIYDLLLQSSYNYTWYRNQVATTPLSKTDQGVDDLNLSRLSQHATKVSLDQLLPTGAILSFFGSYGNTQTWALPTSSYLPVDPYDSFTTGISLVQPLLKGFGPYVTNAPIMIAKIQSKVEEETFRDQVITQLTNAIKLYWDLVFAIENYEVQQKSLERARELLRVATVKRDAGVEAPTVVLEAEAEVSKREALLIQARSAVASAADNLKRAMNLTESSEEWAYNLVPVDRPAYAPVSINEEAIFTEALQQRPDYRTALYGQDMALINKNVAENGKLPELNAGVGVQSTGMGRNVDNAQKAVSSGDYGGWNASLTLKYPLQNRKATATFEAKKAAYDQTKQQASTLQELIRLDVRSAIRSLETNQKLIVAYDSNVKSEEAKLDSQIKRYNVGFSTLFEVLSYQEDLATAQVNYIQSLVSYNKAIIDLQRVKASFLKDYRIEYLDKSVQGK